MALTFLLKDEDMTIYSITKIKQHKMSELQTSQNNYLHPNKCQKQ